MNARLRLAALVLPLTALLNACATNHEFRVAAIGDESVQPTSENTAIAGTEPLVVAAGNVLLGRASQLTTISGAGSNVGVVNGTVTAVLLTTGQTLVELPDGGSLLVNSTTAALGDTVAIDLGLGQVVGGSTSLGGAQVLGTNPVVTLAGGNVAPSVGGVMGPVAGLGKTVLPTVKPGSVLGPKPTVTTIVQPVTGAVGGGTGTVGGLLGPICC